MIFIVHYRLKLACLRFLTEPRCRCDTAVWAVSELGRELDGQWAIVAVPPASLHRGVVSRPRCVLLSGNVSAAVTLLLPLFSTSP